MKNFPLILIAISLNAVGQILLKAGTTSIGVFHVTLKGLPALLWTIIKSPYIDLGIFCYCLSLLFWLWVLSRVPVSVAYPMLSIGYIFSIFAGYIFFGEPITLLKVCGVLIIMLGVYLVSVA